MRRGHFGTPGDGSADCDHESEPARSVVLTDGPIASGRGLSRDGSDVNPTDPAAAPLATVGRGSQATGRGYYVEAFRRSCELFVEKAREHRRLLFATGGIAVVGPAALRMALTPGRPNQPLMERLLAQVSSNVVPNLAVTGAIVGFVLIFVIVSALIRAPLALQRDASRELQRLRVDVIARQAENRALRERLEARALQRPALTVHLDAMKKWAAEQAILVAFSNTLEIDADPGLAYGCHFPDEFRALQRYSNAYQQMVDARDSVRARSMAAAVSLGLATEAGTLFWWVAEEVTHRRPLPNRDILLGMSDGYLLGYWSHEVRQLSRLCIPRDERDRFRSGMYDNLTSVKTWPECRRWEAALDAFEHQRKSASGILARMHLTQAIEPLGECGWCP